MDSATPKPTILVVDDQAVNLKILSRILENKGMNVITASNGLECLEVVKQTPPDVILLDVMMPKMGGIEACERLKADTETSSIPVLFITAKTAREEKIKGLEAGAIDYITKPIDPEETIARVKTQLDYQRINRLNMELQRQVEEGKRAAAVWAVTEGISHNLNNILGAVACHLDMIKVAADNPEMLDKLVDKISASVNRVISIVRQLNTIASTEPVVTESRKLKDVIDRAIERFEEEHEIEANIDIENALPEDYSFETNLEAVTSTLEKLLINAWEAYPEDAQATDRSVHLKVREEAGPDGAPQIVMEIEDEGEGIKEEVADTLFEPLVTGKISVGRGMGLTLARHHMQSLKGDVQVAERDGKGVAAVLRHPVFITSCPLKF